MAGTGLTLNGDELIRDVAVRSNVLTPSGLHVTSDAFDALVKAEARKVAGSAKAGYPTLFSKFQMASNMVAYGAREKPVGTPQFTSLYEASRRSFVDSILIRARIDQTKMVWQRAMAGKQIGFKVIHDRHDDPDFEITDNIKQRCDEVEELLCNPTPKKFRHLYPDGIRVHDGIKDFISRMVRAELIIDRKAMIRYRNRNGRGYGAFHWIPGESIRPVHEGLKAWAKKNMPGTAQKITAQLIDRASQAIGWDLFEADYVQLVDGEIVAAFTEDEISLHIANPSDEMNRFGYGESRLEMSLEVTYALLYAWTYNKEMFNTNYPEQLLVVRGNVDQGGLAEFKRQLTSEAGGVANSWRLPVISAGDENNFKAEAVKLRETPKDMLFDQFFRMMVAMKCAAYGAHPTIINFSPDSPGSGGLFGHNPSDEIEFSKEHGLKPALMDLCEWLTNEIVKPFYSDLRLILTGIDGEDEKASLDLQVEKTKTWKTRNQARVEDGDDAIGDEEDPDNPWNYPADAPMSSYMTALAQKKQLEAMTPQQGEDGQGDEEDGQDVPDGADETAEQPEPVEKSHSETKFLRLTVK